MPGQVKNFGLYHRFGKRAFDLVLTAAVLLALSPLFALGALLVRVKMGAPLLFRQWRAGEHGRPFEIVKLRTMTDAWDEIGHLRPDAERLTAFGQWLRSTSLDELPELANVLRGEMSLVGPRPLLMEYLPRYTRDQGARHEVKPGITGWAQVHGRNTLTWEQKFELDIWYVEHASLWLDVKILARTLRIVATREGISQRDHATSEPFNPIATDRLL